MPQSVVVSTLFIPAVVTAGFAIPATEYVRMPKTVLILTGDSTEGNRLQEIAAKLGLNARIIEDLAGFPDNCRSSAPDLIILDLAAEPDADTVRRARSAFQVPLLGLASAEIAALADRARDAGASEVLMRPFTEAAAEASIKMLLRTKALETEIAKVRARVDEQLDVSDVVAVSEEMQRARALAERAADLDLPVLIEGEPGTGKRLFAKAIHAGSPRRSQPLSVLRFDSASTGRTASGEVDGAELIEQAWDEAAASALFIEEISDLPKSCQESLNRHLARQALEKPHDGTSVRLICSSSKNLIEEVKKGNLREDLYFRINVFPIWLPPLRDRKEDIPALAEHFLRQVIVEEGKPIEAIEDDAMAMLQAYVWPGNVRQLENTVFRAVALADGHRLTIKEFPQVAAQVPGFKANIPSPPPLAVQPRYEGPAMIGGDMPVTRAISLTPFSNNTTIGIPVLTHDGEIRRLEDIEADLIRLALGHYRGHITEVAKRLGIGRSTLYRKMREFGLAVRHN
jgi:DNA-binding NtrC family response regulator